MEIFGYEFKDTRLLDRALTTPSYRTLEPGAADNQRLEFLGDTILQMLATEYVFKTFPDDDEGRLTARRKHMVSAAVLAAAAGRMGLIKHLKMSAQMAGSQPADKFLADAVEAVAGAIWLDGGWEAAKAAFDALGLVDDASPSEWVDNYKGELQLRSQAMTPPRQPRYELLGTSGKSHEPVFKVKVAVEGLGEAEGTGRTKQGAQMQAAKRLLEAIS